MNFRLFGCGKFRYLAIEKFDRELKPGEVEFYRKHREVCFTCMRYEQQSTNAMNLLSAAALEPEISENFDERVLQQYAKSRKNVAFVYWSPILAGAAVAGLAVIASLQLISRSPIHLFSNKQAPAMRYNDDQRDQLATSRNLILPHEGIAR
jgi:hypothetical protein